MAPVRIGVLASGSGTILEALAGERLPIAVVLVDRPCAAEKVAAAAGVPAVLVERRDFGPGFDRDAYSRSVVEALAPFGCDLLAMAGFGTILGTPLHDAYPGRVLNTHPALLPAHKGWHAVDEALAAGEAETGCTVHLATLPVDEGPILAQARVPILAGDDRTSLHERIKVAERHLYPAAIRDVMARLEDEGSPGT